LIESETPEESRKKRKSETMSFGDAATLSVEVIKLIYNLYTSNADCNIELKYLLEDLETVKVCGGIYSPSPLLTPV